MTSFTHGFLLASSLIVGFGPQNLFLIQNSARPSQRLFALILFAGADTILLVISYAYPFLIAEVPRIPIGVRGGSWLYALSGAYLLFYGAKSLFALFRPSKIEEESGSTTSVSPNSLLLSAAVLTFLNPGALCDMLLVVGGAAQLFTGQERVVFYAGAASVSWIWFGFLTMTGKLLLIFPKFRILLECTSAVLMLLIGAHQIARFNY